MPGARTDSESLTHCLSTSGSRPLARRAVLLRIRATRLSSGGLLPKEIEIYGTPTASHSSVVIRFAFVMTTLAARIVRAIVP